MTIDEVIYSLHTLEEMPLIQINTEFYQFQLAKVLHTQHGVLMDLATQITSTYLRAFRRCPDNPDVPLATWRQHLWLQSLPDTHTHLAGALYNDWLELRYKYLELSPETVSLLQSLRQSYLLAIITNGPSNAQWEKINRLNLNKYFDCILVSADLPWEKPNEQIFQAACNYLGVEPANCIMIGDKLETDIQVCYSVAEIPGRITLISETIKCIPFLIQQKSKSIKNTIFNEKKKQVEIVDRIKMKKK